MNKVCITLINDSSSRDVIFDVFDTAIANKWLDEIAKQHPIFENWRFTGWPKSKWTASKYIEEIDKCIDVVNAYQPGTINLKGSDDLNYLHKVFEVLRGSVLTPNPWHTQAPVNVQEAISKFNVLIHNYEKLVQSKHLSPTITCTFGGPRYELAEEDYQHFTYDWVFGTIYINYCEIGKHLLELYGDNDDIVGEDNIRPLTYYSADFKLKFFTDLPREEFLEFDRKFKLWLEDNKSSFNKFKHLSLGFIPVALINYNASRFENLTQREVIDLLSVYTCVGSVKVLV